MKVLFLTCWYPDSENPGTGIFIKEHARAIAGQAGIRLMVLQIWPKRSKDFYRKEIQVFTDENGIETHQVFIFSFAYKLIYLLNWYLNILVFAYTKRFILPNFKPDLIHSNVVFQAGVMGSYIAKKLSVPFFLSEHWSGLNWYLKTPYVNSLAGVKAYHSAKTIFPVSNHLKKFLELKIRGNLRIQVVPNAVDTDRFYYAGHPELGEVVKILCVTNFKTGRAVFKLPGLILDALECMLMEERKRFQICFVGGGDGLDDFKKRIDNLGYSDIALCLGFCDKQAVSSLMQTTHGLAHPSVEETFGVVVAEALCCGTPCIVSDVPALDEQVNETNGILVGQNTPEAWKKGLLKFINEVTNYDREKIARVAGHRFNHKHIGETIVARYKDELY